MLKFVVRRVLYLPIVFLLVSIVAFFGLRITGDPVDLYLPADAGELQRQQLRVQLGLDRPLPVQYGLYLIGVIRGNFGTSLRFQRPALSVALDHLRETVILASLATVSAGASGIVLGIFAGRQQGSILDWLVVSGSTLGLAVPTFWFGILLMLFFGVTLGWLPTSGSGAAANYVMPVVTLAAFVFPQISLLMRSSIVDTLGEYYVTVARSKGLPERAVTWRHVARNALLPTLAALGLESGRLFGGAVITETLFAVPGIGYLSVQAVFHRDVPVVLTCVFFMVGAILLANLAADIAVGFADPRLR